MTLQLKSRELNMNPNLDKINMHGVTREENQKMLRKNLKGTWVANTRENFPIPTDAKSVLRINKQIDQTVKKLKAFAKKEGVTLYCDSMDDQGRMVYKIKELPSFIARIHQPVLV
jgi:hypothetical protein